MKIIFILTLLLSFTAQAYENNTHLLFDNKLSISLDPELKALSPSLLKKRHGKKNNAPSYVFNNKDKNVSFTFTQYPTPADTKSMAKIHKSISNMLRKSNAKSKWKKDKIYSRLGTKIAVYEYETKGIGKYQYNMTYAFPVAGQLTFISFITTEKKYKNKWVALARESMDSIILNQ